MSRVDLKKSPSSRIGQPKEKQSDDLEDIRQNHNSSEMENTFGSS